MVLDSTRAQAVLDRLVREGAATPAIPRRWARVISVLVVVILVAVVVLLRRPAPVEDRLPISSGSSSAETPMVSESPGSGSPGSSTASTGASAAEEREGSDTSAPGGAGTTTTREDVVVHVVGAVASPGVVAMAAGSRVVDAVTAAGGLRADADADRVNLAAPLTDGQRVVVPVVGQDPPVEVSSGGSVPGGVSGVAPGGATAGRPQGPLDLNSATAEQLDSLPGVGPATSAAIVSYREEEGPFRSVDDLLDVRGIGEAKLEAIRDLVAVG